MLVDWGFAIILMVQGAMTLPGAKFAEFGICEVCAVRTVLKFEALFYGLSAEWAFKEDGNRLQLMVFCWLQRSLLEHGHTLLVALPAIYLLCMECRWVPWRCG